MKPNELRIGNYIFDRSGKILRIDGWENPSKVYMDNGTYHLPEPIGEVPYHPLTEEISFLKPIPLTEQWLKDFGFEKPAHSFIGDIFHLSEWDEFPNTWCVAMNKNNAIIFRRLKHAHQLQNLYFALTGEELKLNQSL